MSKNEEDTLIIGEVVTDVNEGGAAGSTRKVRIYDRANGDFVIEIPSESTVTYGYFNPAASGGADEYGRSRGAQTMKTTALRVYAKGAKSSQIACFLGVDGFRDMSINIVRLRQKVTVETSYENDGDGYIRHQGEERKQLVRVVEDDELEDPIF